MTTKALARRIGIGFTGGQVLSLRLEEKELKTLRSQITDKSKDWCEAQAVDGAVLIDLAEVVYLRVESDEQRIGF